MRKLLNFEEMEQFVQTPNEMFKSGNLFALRLANITTEAWTQYVNKVEDALWESFTPTTKNKKES